MADDSAGLGELLMHAARLQRQRWRELLAPWELSPSQVRALRVIGDRDGTRVSDLADSLRIAPRSATEVADSLEARGLAERAPDPRDRRAVLLRATAAGRRVREEVHAARAADSRSFFGHLSAEDRATLARILRELGDREGSASVDEPPVDPTRPGMPEDRGRSDGHDLRSAKHIPEGGR